MLREVLCLLGLIKIVTVKIEDIEQIEKLLGHKRLYLQKYNFPSLTRELKRVYKFKGIDIAECVGGPMSLLFFNRVFYYEWKNK
jgi:hypothetical protein